MSGKGGDGVASSSPSCFDAAVLRRTWHMHVDTMLLHRMREAWMKTRTGWFTYFFGPNGCVVSLEPDYTVYAEDSYSWLLDDDKAVRSAPQAGRSQLPKHISLSVAELVTHGAEAAIILRMAEFGIKVEISRSEYLRRGEVLGVALVNGDYWTWEPAPASRAKAPEVRRAKPPTLEAAKAAVEAEVNRSRE